MNSIPAIQYLSARSSVRYQISGTLIGSAIRPPFAPMPSKRIKMERVMLIRKTVPKMGDGSFHLLL
jgi:hypothetical protein